MLLVSTMSEELEPDTLSPVGSCEWSCFSSEESERVPGIKFKLEMRVVMLLVVRRVGESALNIQIKDKVLNSPSEMPSNRYKHIVY
jgi:hypothetical protein